MAYVCSCISRLLYKKYTCYCRCIDAGLDKTETKPGETPLEDSGGQKKKRRRRSRWAAGVASSSKKKAKKKIFCSGDEQEKEDNDKVCPVKQIFPLI